MLRVLIVLALGIAFIWYLAKDAGQSAKIAEDQRETLEMAKLATTNIEEEAAAGAAQSDSIRDLARGVVPPPAEDDSAQ